jgi:hypothetical protein
MRQKLNDYDSLSNATTIDSALNYIRIKQQRQEQKKQLLSLDSTGDDNGGDDSSDSQAKSPPIPKPILPQVASKPCFSENLLDLIFFISHDPLLYSCRWHERRAFELHRQLLKLINILIMIRIAFLILILVNKHQNCLTVLISK